jgi:hypothetical protein
MSTLIATQETKLNLYLSVIGFRVTKERVGVVTENGCIVWTTMQGLQDWLGPARFAPGVLPLKVNRNYVRKGFGQSVVFFEEL